LRRYGHSEDSRPDLPQIVIGLAVTREGTPVRYWVWLGNTADMRPNWANQSCDAAMSTRW
jgi:transposase